MKQKEEKTVAELIKEMPLDPEYKPASGLPIPLHKGVLVKKIAKSNIFKVGEILLIEGDAENSRPPHLGIIYAIGPNCSEHLKVGLRCYYNFYVDSSFNIDGVDYAKMDESDVFYLVPPNTRVDDGVKGAKEVRRGNQMKKSDSRLIREFNHEQNEKDKLRDSTRGKVKPVYNLINKK